MFAQCDADRIVVRLAVAAAQHHVTVGIALGGNDGHATFLVDPEGVIRFAYVTDGSVGRNPQEVLRVLDALQTDELCPCNWNKGEDTLKVA